MRRLTASMLALSVTACSAAPAGQSGSGAIPKRTGQDWSVSQQVSSWGMTRMFWLVRGDGSGEVWRVTGERGFSDFDLGKFRMRMDAAALEKFLVASDPVLEATRRPVKCKQTITDLPYGEMIWRHGSKEHKFNYDFGCTSAEADKVYTMMGHANEAVDKFATVETEPYAVEHIGRR